MRTSTKCCDAQYIQTGYGFSRKGIDYRLLSTPDWFIGTIVHRCSKCGKFAAIKITHNYTYK